MLIKRGNVWWMTRRVPKVYSEVETRKAVWISLKTDSEKAATKKEPAVWAEMIAGWESQMRGDSKQAEHKFSQAKANARQMGFQYVQASDFRTLPISEIVDRVEASATPSDAVAVLGLADVPKITASAALELYWDLAVDKVVGKTDDQLRRFKNPRIRAFKRFISIAGDLDIGAISRDDMLLFKKHLMQRVRQGEITVSTANKDIIHFTGTVRYVESEKALGLNLPFEKLALEGGAKSSRDPFTTSWIKEKILYPGALNGLNREAAAILLMMVNTGARPSELAGLLPHHFDLNGPIPLIHILPEGRQLKNDHAKRKIPLAGVSLEAAREFHSSGFPTYAGKDKVSDTINKFMRENDLKETKKTTLYSLRHSFEDRMLEAGVDERVRSDIFGHALQRQRYGAGGGDELRHQAIKLVAL